jgi:hypothetical protein
MSSLRTSQAALPDRYETRVAALLSDRIAELREALFELSELARRDAPHEPAALHVSLQAAANELGGAERILAGDAGAGAPL